jgi:hypothetical protein
MWSIEELKNIREKLEKHGITMDMIANELPGKSKNNRMCAQSIGNVFDGKYCNSKVIDKAFEMIKRAKLKEENIRAKYKKLIAED